MGAEKSGRKAKTRMEVVFCQHQLKLQEKTYGVMLVELTSGSRNEKEQIKKVLKSYLDHEEELVWKFNREEYRFKVRELYYICSYHRKAEVYTRKGVFRIPISMLREEITLNKKGFVRVHQGFWIRKEVIRSIKPEGLILENNMHIPVSRKYKKNVKNIFGKL